MSISNTVIFSLWQKLNCKLKGILLEFEAKEQTNTFAILILCFVTLPWHKITYLIPRAPHLTELCKKFEFDAYSPWKSQNLPPKKPMISGAEQQAKSYKMVKICAYYCQHWSMLHGLLILQRRCKNLLVFRRVTFCFLDWCNTMVYIFLSDWSQLELLWYR